MPVNFFWKKVWGYGNIVPRSFIKLVITSRYVKLMEKIDRYKIYYHRQD
jgi:hypothetical protein